MIKIGASALAADFMQLGNELKRAECAGCERLHVDVMDGHLVRDIAFGAENVKSICAATNLEVEAHLMVAEPQRFWERMILAGAKIITLQFEPCKDFFKTVSEIREAGADAHVCIRPGTPVCMLEEAAAIVSGILLVAVPLGIGGQAFIPSMYEKIKKLNQWKIEMGYSFEIGVDGGVTVKNAADIRTCGADYLVCGTTVFAAQNMKEVVCRVRGD